MLLLQLLLRHYFQFCYKLYVVPMYDQDVLLTMQYHMKGEILKVVYKFLVYWLYRLDPVHSCSPVITDSPTKIVLILARSDAHFELASTNELLFCKYSSVKKLKIL